MPEIKISGITVNFPYEPYDVQKAYMSKVIECLQNRTNGVLESPTGTGKTLSLLCSTLGWILQRKAQVQADMYTNPDEFKTNEQVENDLDLLNTPVAVGRWHIPKVIYSSRTHSQLSQAMHELKRSSYNFMKSVAVGSRDQLCIHPEVSKETSNSNKIHLCKLRVTTHTCSFHNRVEKQKSNIKFKEQPILDIEDLVKYGHKLKMCPYYGSKEFVNEADIIFMPYNYLLDPKARKANKIDLNNAIVILDEAHNVEKMCEESASVQLKSSDIALAINDVTQVMGTLSEDNIDNEEEAKDFTLDDLTLLKEMLLELEKVVDEIEIPFKNEGITQSGGYVFELLEKANIKIDNHSVVSKLLDSLIQYLSVATAQQNSAFRKGLGLETISDFLVVAFSDVDNKEKMARSFKLHINIEEQKQKSSTKKDGWISKTETKGKNNAKIINYWCFNPGYGMDQLGRQNIHSIILTSGTLAPLKPLIAELGLSIPVQLENPHIVGKNQVCVKIFSSGPDNEVLNSSYKNRDNVNYINSLGRTIMSFSPVIPDGMLVFFPSYPLLNKCVDTWQANGIWSQITRTKPIYVEPRSKDAFNSTIEEYYGTINEKKTKGAIFMAVCRGKVSEGLDFADVNGRAVLITGLPFPPLKDSRVILKKKYLEENRTKENELLSGENWYSLEAIRAVNQAIGRVIRHKNDYGAILLCDERFNQPYLKNQLSKWIHPHLAEIQQRKTFGQLIRELAVFFRTAERTLPQPVKREWNELSSISDANNSSSLTDSTELASNSLKFGTTMKIASDKYLKAEASNEVLDWNPKDYSVPSTSVKKSTSRVDFLSGLDRNVSCINFDAMCTNASQDESELVTIHNHKRERSSAANNSFNVENVEKRRKLKIANSEQFQFDSSPVKNPSSVNSNSSNCSHLKEPSKDENSLTNNCEANLPKDRKELLTMIKTSISQSKYNMFTKALVSYKTDENFDNLFSELIEIFDHPALYHLLRSMRRYLKEKHKSQFDINLNDLLK